MFTVLLFLHSYAVISTFTALNPTNRPLIHLALMSSYFFVRKLFLETCGHLLDEGTYSTILGVVFLFLPHSTYVWTLKNMLTFAAKFACSEIHYSSAARNRYRWLNHSLVRIVMFKCCSLLELFEHLMYEGTCSEERIIGAKKMVFNLFRKICTQRISLFDLCFQSMVAFKTTACAFEFLNFSYFDEFACSKLTDGRDIFFKK